MTLQAPKKGKKKKKKNSRLITSQVVYCVLRVYQESTQDSASSQTGWQFDKFDEFDHVESSPIFEF